MARREAQPDVGHQGRECGDPRCPGQVRPMVRPVRTPDYWVRRHNNGSWWCSTVPPVIGTEWPGHRGFRCSECTNTVRTIEGGPFGFPAQGEER